MNLYENGSELEYIKVTTMWEGGGRGGSEGQDGESKKK